MYKQAIRSTGMIRLFHSLIIVFIISCNAYCQDDINFTRNCYYNNPLGSSIKNIVVKDGKIEYLHHLYYRNQKVIFLTNQKDFEAYFKKYSYYPDYLNEKEKAKVNFNKYDIILVYVDSGNLPEYSYSVLKIDGVFILNIHFLTLENDLMDHTFFHYFLVRKGKIILPNINLDGVY